MALTDRVLSCIWSLSINGVALDLQRKRSIESINIDTACDGSDTATITVVDKDLVYINDNIFVDEASVYISLMFIGFTDKVEFSGYVSAIDISFPEDGMPVLKLTCLDNSHLMNRVKKKRSWTDVTRMDVAEKIAAEYGFKFEGDSSYSGEKEETVSQSNETDIAFLENLASQEKGVDIYMCKLVGDTIVYKKKGILSNPVMTVNYKKYPYEVVSFSPKITKETMTTETEEGDIATDTKKTDVAVSTGTNNTTGQKVNTIASTPTSTTTNTTVSSGSTTQNKPQQTQQKPAVKKYDPVTQTWK